MTKVPQGFDFSFLNDEEARKILRVLERNEELQRAEKDRIRYKANGFLSPRGPGRAQEARSFRGVPAGASKTRSRAGGHLRGGFLLRTSGCLVDALATHSIPEGLACESRVSCPRHAGGFGAFFSGWVLRPVPGHVGGVGLGESRLGGGPGSHALLCLGGLLGSRGAGAKWSGVVGPGRCVERNLGPRARTHALTQLLQVVRPLPTPSPSVPGTLSSPHADGQQGPEELVPPWREAVPRGRTGAPGTCQTVGLGCTEWTAMGASPSWGWCGAAATEFHP